MRRRKRPQRPAKRAEDCKKHFMRRWRERVGEDHMTAGAAYHAILRAIQNSDRSAARYVDTQSTTRTVFEVSTGGREYEVVYNRKLGSLVTVLPNTPQEQE